MNTVGTNSLGYSFSEYFQLLLTIIFRLLSYFINCFKLLKLRHYLVTPSTVYHGTPGNMLIGLVKLYVTGLNANIIGVRINIFCGALQSDMIYYSEKCVQPIQEEAISHFKF